MSTNSLGGRGRRPFVQGAYDSNGRLSALPLDCPFGGRGETCSTSAHGTRPRKTGPSHGLAVVHCQVHEQWFTVYPAGFVPYARRQLVDGDVLHDEPSLMEIVDEAAVQGGRSGAPDGGGSRSTQGRLLARVSRMFGLDGEAARTAVTLATGIPLSSLDAASKTRPVHERGLALQRLRRGLSADDLLRLGATADCWGPPHRWLEHRQQLWPLARGDPTTSGADSERAIHEAGRHDPDP